MDYTDKERKLIDKIMRLIRTAKVEPVATVVVLSACAARAAVRGGTHSCHDFHELAHGMFHDAERVVAMVDETFGTPEGVGGLKN